MNSNEIRRQKKIEKVIKACDKVTAELQGTALTNGEFTVLSDKLNRLMQVVYQQRSRQTRAGEAAFSIAMSTLQTLRRKS